MPEQHLFLRRFPVGNGRWQVSMESIRDSCRSHSGDRLLYVAKHESERMMIEMEVKVDENGVELGEPKPLFPMPANRLGDFDVAPDSQRFLMSERDVKPEDRNSDKGIVIVENWFEEFRAP